MAHNRLIRGGLLDSDRVNQIADDPQCEVFYRRLLSVVDDLGCFSADPRLLRASLYPLRVDTVTELQVTGWIAACVSVGLLRLYEAHGKQYLWVWNFSQRLRRMTLKHPLPPWLSEPDSGFGPPEAEAEAEAEAEVEPEVEEENNTCPPQSGGRMRSGSSSSGRNKKAPSQEQEGWFASWWAIYWRRVSRVKALDAFCRHVTTAERFEQVMAATRAQSPVMLSRKEEHRPHATTWLNGERWNDEAAPVQQDAFSELLNHAKENQK